MEVKHVVGGLVAIALLAWFAHGLRDPLRTALPFGTTDLSSVQVQLKRLSPADRALVEAYVRRSHGDVLPAKFADPDQPFTARTLGEAIALEKAWDVRRDAKDAEAARRQAERDAAMAPLRDAVEAGVARAEVLARGDLYAARDPSAPATPASPGEQATVFVVTVSLHNLGGRTITGVQGSLEARDREAWLPLNLCWVDLGGRGPIEPASRVEIRCANPNRHASAQERAFIDDDSDRFTLVWNPRRVEFADGSSLDSGL